MKINDQFSDLMSEALAILDATRENLKDLEESLKDLTREAGYYVEKIYDVFDLSDNPNDDSSEAEK